MTIMLNPEMPQVKILLLSPLCDLPTFISIDYANKIHTNLIKNTPKIFVKYDGIFASTLFLPFYQAIPYDLIQSIPLLFKELSSLVSTC